MVSNAVLTLAVVVLFFHALFQQSVLYDIKSQLTDIMLSKKVNEIAKAEPKAEPNIASSSNLVDNPLVEVPNYLKAKSPPNLPSVRLSPEEEKKAATIRTIYGGKGDALHLGGFTQLDTMGISENLWNYMMGPLAIKSVVDVGCGKGVSTNYFRKQGARVLCVEGSHDAVTQSLLPPELVVEHDFSRGPWWPEDTFDAVWSVEFLEVILTVTILINT